MYFILPAAQLSEDLTGQSLSFSMHYGLDSLTEEQSVEVVQSLIENVIFGRLYWVSQDARNATSPKNVDNIMSRYLPWWVEGVDLATLVINKRQNDPKYYEHHEASEQFHLNVIDPLILRITRMLDDRMGGLSGDDLWCVWYTKPLGRDLVVEKGEDYRILAYEHLVMNNQIPVEPHIKNHIFQKNRHQL